jgi:MraZ protein
VIYPEGAWLRITDVIAAQPLADPDVRALRRFLFADASPLELDSQGRLVLSAALRTWAEIERTATIVGMDATIEVWSTTTWNRIAADVSTNAASVFERLRSSI